MNLSLPIADKIKEWIPIEQCKNGWLYVIAARNASIGIYRFCGEYHWDWQGGEILFGKKLLGTAKPVKAIDKAPEFKNEQEFIDYMERKFQELQSDGK